MFFANETKPTSLHTSYSTVGELGFATCPADRHSPSYMGSLVKTVCALSKAFLVPWLGGLRAASVFITSKIALLMEDRLKAYKEKLAKLEKQLAKHGTAQGLTVKKLRLKVAKAKMAQLASMPLLWQTICAKELRTPVVVRSFALHGLRSL